MAATGLIPGHQPDLLQRLRVESTPAALDAVRDGAADYACAPIENSIDGSLASTLDSLAIGSPLQVFAETTLDVAFSIVVQSGRSAADVRTVAAFPVAAAQVRQWLTAHLPGAQLRPAYSNADAARQVADGEVDAAVTSAAGRRALGAGDAGGGRGRRDQRPHPLRPDRAARAPSGANRGRSHLGGVADRERAGRAAADAHRVRDAGNRPDPHRIPADPYRVGHLHVFRGLRRPHRRRRRRRGAQGVAPSLRGRALPGFLADRPARGSATAVLGRGIELVGQAAGGQARTPAGPWSGANGGGDEHR